MDKELFGKRLSLALNRANVKKSRLAFRLGIHRSSITKYCAGAVMPSGEMLVQIAKTLGVSEQWLMGADVPMERVELDPNTYEMTVSTLPSIIPSLSGKELEILINACSNEASKDRLISYAKKLIELNTMEDE